MLRRTFLASIAAFTAFPALALTGRSYQSGLVEKELKAGKIVFIDFYTDWCTTCRSQQKTINALKSENPDYEKHISFVAVDWDIHAHSKLAFRLKIPRRATLVLLKGDKELGRIVAGTRKKDIKALMDTGLMAASA